MAKPIKITPLLRGKDAVNFHRALESNRNMKVTRSFLSEIRASAKEFQSILKSK